MGDTSWASSITSKSLKKCLIDLSKLSSFTNAASMTRLQHIVWWKQRMNANIGMQKRFTFTTIHQQWGVDYFSRSTKEKEVTHRQHIVLTNAMNTPQIGTSTSSIFVATPRRGTSPPILIPLLNLHLRNPRPRNLQPRTLRPRSPIQRQLPANHVPHMSAVLKRAGRRRGGWQRRWVLWMLWRQKVRVLLGQTHLSINNVYFSHYLT